LYFLSALNLAVFLPRALRIAVAQCDRPLPHRVRASLCDLIIRTRLSEDYANATSFDNSPMKKKGALPAGIPRASGERNSPTGNGAFSHSQVRLAPFCIIPIHLWIAAASICSPAMRLFVMHHGPRGETDQKFDSSRCCGLRKTHTPGRQSLLSTPPLPSRPTMQHSLPLPPTSSIILPSMKLATLTSSPSQLSSFSENLFQTSMLTHATG
jgi:hypothetical protein